MGCAKIGVPNLFSTTTGRIDEINFASQLLSCCKAKKRIQRHPLIDPIQPEEYKIFYPFGDLTSLGDTPYSSLNTLLKYAGLLNPVS